MISFGKKSIFALDIGASSVKLVQLKKVKKGYELVGLASAPLLPEVIVDGAIMDSGAVVDVVRELVSSAKIKATEVSASVSGHSVIIKKIMLPATTEEELADSIQWEAEQYIPFDITDVNLDFKILGENPEDASQVEVLLVAAKKEIIDDYTAVITEAGLNPVVIDVDAFAVQNMVELNYDFEEGEAVAVANVGAEITMINIMRNGGSLFNRDISNAGNQLTQEVQKRFGVTFEEAISAKMGEEVDGVDAQELLEVIGAACDSLASEINRTIDFFLATNPDLSVNKLYLSGGGARVSGLADVVGKKLGIDVALVNPFNKIAYSKKAFDPEYLAEVGPSYGVAVGLAIRELGD